MRCFLDRRFSAESAVLADAAMRQILFDDTQLRRDGGAPIAASGFLLTWNLVTHYGISDKGRIFPMDFG